MNSFIVFCFAFICVVCFVLCYCFLFFFFFSSRRRHTRYIGDWSSDVCSSDLVSDGADAAADGGGAGALRGDAEGAGRRGPGEEIGRASCRERVEITGGAGALKKKK